LTDDDLGRVGIDPQRQPVGALVVIPLVRVVPERIRVLPWQQVFAKRPVQPRPISRLGRVVLHAVAAVEHEQRQVETGQDLPTELGEGRIFQSRLGDRTRPSPQYDPGETALEVRVAEERETASVQSGLIAGTRQRTYGGR